MKYSKKMLNYAINEYSKLKPHSNVETAWPITEKVNYSTSNTIKKPSEEQKTSINDANSKIENNNKQSQKIFLQTETKIKANFKLNLQNTVRTNSPILSHDFWQWFIDLLQTLSFDNEMKQAKLKVEDLKHKLESVRNDKRNVEIDLEELRFKLSNTFCEKHTAMAIDQTNPNVSLDLKPHGNVLKDLERKLLTELKNLSVKEENYLELYLLAVKDANEKENFKKTAIFYGTIFTFVFIYAVVLVYIHENNSKNKKNSWKNYSLGYLSALYSWFSWPKK